MSDLRVGIAGCGAVGTEFLKLLQTDTRIKISAILVKNLKKSRKFSNYFYTDSLDVFLDTDFDAYVDLCSDYLLSMEILKTTLSRGDHAVLCNKELLWTSHSEIFNLAKNSGSIVMLNSLLSCASPYTRPDVNLSILNIENYSEEDLYSFRGAGPEETALDIYSDLIKLIEATTTK